MTLSRWNLYLGRSANDVDLQTNWPLTFYIENPGNGKIRFLTRSLLACNVFTICLILSTFKYIGGNIIFLMPSSGSCRSLVLRSDFEATFSPPSVALELYCLLFQEISDRVSVLKEPYHFKVTTNDPIVFGILQRLTVFLHVSLFFTKTNWISNWGCAIEITIVEDNTLWAIDEHSPLKWVVYRNYQFLPSTLYIMAIHKPTIISEILKKSVISGRRIFQAGFSHSVLMQGVLQPFGRDNLKPRATFFT